MSVAAVVAALLSTDRRLPGPRTPITLQPALPLDQVVTNPGRHAGRRIVVRGSYDFARTVFVLGATFQEQTGARVYTPMRIAGGEGDLVVLIDRGWIPEVEIETFIERDVASGEREIYGTLQPQTFGSPPREPKDVPRRRWQSLRPGALQGDLPYRLLPLILSREAGSGVELPLAAVSGAPPGRPTQRAAQWLWVAAAALGLGSLALRGRGA